MNEKRKQCSNTKPWFLQILTITTSKVNIADMAKIMNVFQQNNNKLIIKNVVFKHRFKMLMYLVKLTVAIRKLYIHINSTFNTGYSNIQS